MQSCALPDPHIVADLNGGGIGLALQIAHKAPRITSSLLVVNGDPFRQ